MLAIENGRGVKKKRSSQEKIFSGAGLGREDRATAAGILFFAWSYVVHTRRPPLAISLLFNIQDTFSSFSFTFFRTLVCLSSSADKITLSRRERCPIARLSQPVIQVETWVNMVSYGSRKFRTIFYQGPIVLNI